MDLHYWGSLSGDGCRLVAWLESRCVSILVGIGMQLPGSVARIWPERFTEAHTESFTTSGHYHGLYLIGLDWDGVDGEPISKLKLNLAHETLQEILQHFTRRIRGGESYFDPQRLWLNASLVPDSELGRMSPDDQDWGEYQSDDESSDEEVADPMEASSAGSAEPARQSKCKTGYSRAHKAAAPVPRP
ncbi:uncharacterized protein VDAG_09052 [Verticillium dahliae VdLs.17]|uniref:Uncharacterized protein n=1 Tax=Verticillium dahliae (strain VdLs.17 / ATCC MYA-4575 / FGSC 10137) TaxID=498257 RepID=G2XG73_VERDV|nr:uncharacterized protein VDAG_09052 [Verticillium dahliae VdLs.17]EGY18892.1 hypothetical protein VDAG_09052 [Verticillium dahliae VdLs.17]KAH6702596.1 hypothetical protein EV126DRAFT_230878 [Verticillium dahliae]